VLEKALDAAVVPPLGETRAARLAARTFFFAPPLATRFTLPAAGAATFSRAASFNAACAAATRAIGSRNGEQLT